MQQQFRKDFQLTAKWAVLEDVAVYFQQSLNVSASDVPKPFKYASSAAKADWLCLHDLSGAHISKSTQKDIAEAPLSFSMLIAMILGKRVITSEYISKVSKVHGGIEECRDFTKLPPSVKFQALPLQFHCHILLGKQFEAHNDNACRIIAEACSRHRSKWVCYTETRNMRIWKDLKTTNDAIKAKYEAAQAMAPKKKGPKKAIPNECNTEFVHVTTQQCLAELVRRRSVVDRHRCTYGRFAKSI